MKLNLKIEKKRDIKKTARNRKPGYYRISDLVYDFKVTPRKLRYYDQIGLLRPLRVGDNRYYDSTQYRRMQIVLQAQFLGLRLEDIAKLFTEHGDITLTQIVNLLSSRQLSIQRDEIVRQKQHMDAVVAEINSVLRTREESFCLDSKQTVNPLDAVMDPAHDSPEGR